ncbi:MAG: 50S ribosomal protein L25 [Ignavibacteriae bacterium]|nr:50S ribosomal protein L25 [Ignavibacteriota bacterium]
MAEIILKAERRTDFKKSISNQMRKAGFIPGIYYSFGEEPISIKVNELALRPLVFTSESNIVSLQIEGEKKPISCILKDTQFEPVTGRIIHFDVLGLKEGEKLTIEVSLILKGSAIGVKEGGIVQHNLHKLEIECLPQNIPPHIDVDITNLNIGDSIKVSDIKIEGIEILNELNASIVSVVPPVIEAKPEEVVVEGEVPAEPEVISKGKKEETEEKKTEKKS